MSCNLHVDAELLARLKLKLGINRALATAARGEHYRGQIEKRFSYLVSKEVFDSVVSEMEHEGLLRTESGRQGGLLLVRCTPSPSDCRPSISEVSQEAR
jgi:hypothetical protein